MNPNSVPRPTAEAMNAAAESLADELDPRLRPRRASAFDAVAPPAVHCFSRKARRRAEAAARNRTEARRKAALRAAIAKANKSRQ